MHSPLVHFVLSALVAAGMASSALGQLTGTLTSGGATFTLSETPTDITSPSYTADFQPQGGTTADHLYAQWMFFRVSGDARELPFGNYGPAGGPDSGALTGTLSGDTMTYHFTRLDGTGAAQFTADWSLKLQAGATPGTATVTHTVTITNTTASPLTLSMFHYLDYDLADDPSGHSATGGLSGMTITKDSFAATYKPVTGPSLASPTAYQVAPGGLNSLDSLLLDSNVTNLNNTGLPFTDGDWTGAYQWDLTLAPGESRTIQFEMGVTPVPEPGFALAVAGFGLVGCLTVRAKRRKPA